MIQTELVFTGKELAKAGAKLAVDHADAVHFGWSELAYGYLKEFIATHAGPFMTEDVREFAYKRGLPKPESERAWGAVTYKASHKTKIIEHAGYGQVKNPLAHSANASIWQRVI